jgi:hypothetical protein
VGGGAWPFLVGGVICLVNSVNERDLNLLNSDVNPGLFTSSSQGGGVPFFLSSQGGGMVVRPDLLFVDAS